MEPSFWIKVWQEGRTFFHLQNVHPKLIKYFPKLQPQKGQRVLVPLCGKTIDLLWLHEQGLQVHGVELHAQAVEAFFQENKLSPVKKDQDSNYIHYTFKNILISCGDFFKLGETESYDLIYDRASLVALPQQMRKKYAETTKQALKKGGKILLITYEYDQSKMEGPPFSVPEEEIRSLYGDQLTIQLLESEPPPQEGPRLSAVEGLKQVVYLLGA